MKSKAKTLFKVVVWGVAGLAITAYGEAYANAIITTDVPEYILPAIESLTFFSYSYSVE